MRTTTIIIALFLLTGLANGCEAAEYSKLARAAEELADRAEFEQAVKGYNEALSIAPNDAVCLARRGFAYANLGNYKQAFADFDAAIKCDSNCADAYYGRSQLHRWLGLQELAEDDARKALELGHPPRKNAVSLLEHASLLDIVGKRDAANAELKQVLALSAGRNDVTTLLSAAIAHDQLSQYKEAARCLDRAFKLSPTCYYIHFLRGWVYRNDQKWMPALSEINRYMTYNHHNARAFDVRANCYLWLHKPALEIADDDEAIRLAPNSYGTFLCRGLTHYNLKQYEKAVADFSALIALGSTDPFVYRSRVHIYVHLKDWADALKDTRYLISTNPKDPESYIYQGWVHDEAGQYSEAIADYNNVIALEPKKSIGYYGRGLSHRKLKHYKEAIADLSEAIKYDPKNAIRYCARGSALVSDHQYKRAIADCNQSLKLDPKRVHPHLSRGIAYARLGRYKLALQDFNQAIKRSPDYGEAYYERSLVYKSLGDKARYKNDHEKAIKYGYGSP